jgi:hypothetical protein
MDNGGISQKHTRAVEDALKLVVFDCLEAVCVRMVGTIVDN